MESDLQVSNTICQHPAERTSNSENQPSEIMVYEEHISTDDEYLDEAISLPQAPMVVEVVNCEEVQIGSTVNVHGPAVVTEGSCQNLRLPFLSASTQVNVYEGSTVQTGPRISYNNLINVTNIVEANTVRFDESERLAIEDQMQLQRDASVTTTVNFISRQMWPAWPPKRIGEHLQHPVPYVVLTHTVTEECLTLEECAFLIRHMQKYHMDCNKWDDIGFNFLIGGDGNVYEGRGWDVVGSYAGEKYNKVSIGIAVIGNFMDVLPSKRQLRAIEVCIEEGVKLGKLSEDYKVLMHCQLRDSESPGTKFIELIKTWPRWSKTPCTEKYLTRI
ncbi:hypothetical protein C0J52_21011 [Blattella germanica]|nr:hypothetical protein C0J52_21011 [Blattella germanica]